MLLKSILYYVAAFLVTTICLGLCLDVFTAHTAVGLRSHDPRYEGIAYEIYDKKNQENGPSVYFLGSSKTMCDIIPEKVESKLKSTRVMNLGVNWPGENLYKPLCRRICEEKNVKALVIEVPYLNRYAGHKNFRLFCSFQESLEEPFLGSAEYVSNVIFTPYRQLYQFLLEMVKPLKPSLVNKGYHHVVQTDQEKENIRKSFQKEIDNGVYFTSSDIEVKSKLGKLRKEILGKPSRSNYAFLANYCKEQGVECIFLALPKFSIYEMTKEDRDFYQSMGTLLVPPPAMLHKSELWRDTGHLNDLGAKILSEWVGDELKKTGKY